MNIDLTDIKNELAKKEPQNSNLSIFIGKLRKIIKEDVK